jgi:hypothetical protein
MTSHPAGKWRCPSLAVWLGLLASLLLMVGGVWDIAWHHTLGRDTFWSPPHLVLYGGVGVMGFVCLGVVLRMRAGHGTGSGAEPPLVELWGLRAPRGFALAGAGVFGAVLSAPVDEAWHRLFGVDVTVWSPPHLFAIAAAGAIRLGLVVALVDEMARAGQTIPRQRLGWSWPRTPLAEGVLLVLFGIVLGNLLFALGDHEFRGVSRAARLYPLLASLVVPVVLVAGVRTLGRLGAATGIVLVLLAFQVLLRTGLRAAGFGLPAPWPLWPLYLVPALAVDGWYGLIRRRPQAVWHDAVAGLLFAGCLVGLVAGEEGSAFGRFWSLDWLLTASLAGLTGAASGWAGAPLSRWLLTASRTGGPPRPRADPGTTRDASAPPRRGRSRSRP